MRFILPGSSWKWKGQRLGSCSALQVSGAGLAVGLAAQCCHPCWELAPPGSSGNNPHTHLCPTYLSHLFVNVSMPFVRQAGSSHCSWMSVLEALTVTVGEGLGQRCVGFRVLSGHSRLIRQLSGSEQQCLCNFIPADWTKWMHTWSPIWDLPINRGGAVGRSCSPSSPLFCNAEINHRSVQTVLLPLWQMDFLHMQVHHKYHAKLSLCQMKLFPITFHFVSVPHT